MNAPGQAVRPPRALTAASSGAGPAVPSVGSPLLLHGPEHVGSAEAASGPPELSSCLSGRAPLEGPGSLLAAEAPQGLRPCLGLLFPKASPRGAVSTAVSVSAAAGVCRAGFSK